MALADQPPVQPRPAPGTPAMGAQRIRIVSRQILERCSFCLETINRMIEKHGRAAIDAELGGDVAELEAFFAGTKAAVETHRPDLGAQPDIKA